MKNLFPTYNRHIMEAVRQLTIEESLMLLHDLAYTLHEDRLRDVGPSRSLGMAEAQPVRPGWLSLDPLDHTMRSAGFDMAGVQKHQDLVDAFGEEVATAVSANQFQVVEYMSHIGDLMQEYEVSMKIAFVIDAAMQRGQQIDIDNMDIPDTLDGFGWED
jgi:hypothetical protein